MMNEQAMNQIVSEGGGAMSHILLRSEEIYAILNDVNIWPNSKMDAAILKRPSSSFVQSIYLNIFKKFSIDTEGLSSPLPGGVDALQDLEMHQELKPYNIFIYMDAFMCDVGIRDFNLMDVLSPSPKRLRNILSALCNFLLFTTTTTIPIIEGVKSEVNDLKANHSNLVDEVSSLQKKKHTLIIQREEDKLKRTEYDVKISNVQKEVNELNSKKDVLQKEYNDVKENLVVMSNQLKELKLIQTQKANEIEDTKKLVVTSPDRFRLELAQCKEELQKKSAESEEMIQKEAEIKRQQDLFKQLMCELGEKLVYTVNQDNKQAINLERELHTKHDNRMNLQTKLDNYSKVEHENTTRLQSKQTKLNGLKKIRSKETQAWEEELVASKNSVAELSQARREADIVEHELDADIVKKTKECNQWEQALLRQRKQAREQYEEKLASFHSYMQSVKDGLATADEFYSSKYHG